MKLGIFLVDQRENWGPGKVGLNLIKGLDKKKIDYRLNEVCEFNYCPHGIGNYSLLPDNTPVGPNIFSVPSDQPAVINKFQNFVFNSEWSKRVCDVHKLMEHKNKYIWSVGIDTEQFVKEKTIKQYDCFIHFKSRSSDELRNVERMLKTFNQTYNVLRHGTYEPHDIIKYSSECDYCIILDNTETQGIANMEIMSCGVPCFVFDKTSWRGGFQGATSVPYFDERCGVKTNFENDYEYEFINFISNLWKYNPREYMLENHTLEISIDNLLRIVEETHANK